MDNIHITTGSKLAGNQGQSATVQKQLQELFRAINCTIPFPCTVTTDLLPAEASGHTFTVSHAPDMAWEDKYNNSLQALELSFVVLKGRYLKDLPALSICCRFSPQAPATSPEPASQAPTTPGTAATQPTAENDFTGGWQIEQPKYSLKHWIVSDKVKEQFNDAVSIMRYREKIYEEWGFGEVDPNPRAIVCFYGPPGTGKTMAAHVIAHELGKPILCADYAQVESKYLGESPKRLAGAFKAAAQNDAVLFFDEADSFLGKRIENVQQGSDQATNSLRSSMLILLENFKGVVIFATNLVTNFDKAFESRVLAFIEVELPSRDARRAIIKSMLPDKMPLEPGFADKDFDTLADISDGFSGRHIRSAMQLGLVKAAKHSAGKGKDEIRPQELMAAFLQVKETIGDLKRKRGEAPSDSSEGKELDLTEAEKVSLAELAQKKLDRHNS